VYELAKRAAEIACEVADAAPRPVVVAGSIGPTGELFEPLGALTESAAIESFGELAEGLKAGGADIAWIETMSAAEEIRAAATGALQAGLRYTATCSFDTAGRTMMGLLPGDLSHVFDGLAEPPVAIGANCGVGASDILVSLLAMTERDVHTYLISKGNCGVPYFAGTEAHYTGTPELMGKYAQLAVKAGARVVGGCCGTSPVHLAAMRKSLDELIAKPTIDDIIDAIGPLVNSAPSVGAPDRERRRGRRGE
jgi:5-methyltetrahydrofolate--homocysteine methyltransferase